MNLIEESKKVGKAITLGGIDLIPGGSIATRLIDEYLPDAFNQRKEEFVSMLNDRLDNVDQEVIEKLRDDDSFMFLVAKILRKVSDEPNKEKLDLYANVVSNLVELQSIEADKKIMFINFLGDLTSRHIKVLAVLRSPEECLENEGIKLNITMGGVSTMLERLIPDYKTNEAFYKNVIKDLYSSHLTTLQELGTTMSYDGVVAKRTSSFGDEFLEFVQ